MAETYFFKQMNTTIISTNRRKTISKGMRTLITLKPVEKKSRKRYAQTGTDFDKIYIEHCVSQNRREVSCSLRFTQRLHEENHLRFSNSKHFRFYWTKKHFISAWYFTKNHEIGSLVVRTVKRSWKLTAESWVSTSFAKLLIFFYRLDESKSFKSS